MATLAQESGFTFSASGTPQQVKALVSTAKQLPSWLKQAYIVMIDNAQAVGSKTCAFTVTESRDPGKDSGTTLVTTFNQGYY